jgi:hypothetical protein
MRDRNEHPADPSQWPEFYPPQRPADQTRYLSELPDEPADAARTAGLKRLSRLTWHVTQLGAITAVGFATVFARTAPTQTLSSSHAAPTVSATMASPTPTASPRKMHRKHHGTSAAQTNKGQSQGQPTAQPGSQPAAKATKSASAAAPKPALSPPTTAPAAAPPPPPSSAPAPAPTVSSASTGHGG